MDRKRFMMFYGQSLEEWTVDLFERYSDREKFMEAVRMNAERPKVARLNCTHIYMDHYEPDFRPWLLRKLFPRT